MARLNTGNDILTLQKEIERLRYQLLQYKTLLGVSPFSKQELKGDQGGIGPRGLRGETGEKGTKGDKGDKGDIGLQGIQGATGAQGAKGDTGIQGAKGEQGITGPQGAKGLQGEQGVQGLKGDKGDQGIQGIQGIQGLRGYKGDAFEYADFTPAQIAELQQPATDAIASIQAVELSVEQAEAIRVQAEIDRQTNTGTAIQNAETATQNADTATDLALEVANHPDIIQNDYWYKWNTTTDVYENTNIVATGKSAYQSYLDTTTDNPPLSEAAWGSYLRDLYDLVNILLPENAMITSSGNYVVSKDKKYLITI